MSLHRCFIVCALLWAPISAVIAQERPAIPSTAQPGTVERQLQTPHAPVQSTESSVVTLPAEPQAPPPNAASLTFRLSTLSVEGNQALSSSALTQPYAGLIGTTVSVERIYAIASDMTARYRDAGYILSSVIVPPQSITDGHVRLQAVEGYIARISLEGNAGHRQGLFQRMGDKVVSDRPLRNETLERYLLLINDLPGMTAQGVLRPSPSTPGAAELVVRLRTSHVGFVAGATDRGSHVQGPAQIQASVDLDSVLSLEEESTFQYLQAVPGSELRLYSLDHNERLTASGLELKLSGSYSDSSPSLAAQLAALNLATSTAQGRVELDYPFIRTRAWNLSARVAYTYNRSKTDTSAGLESQDRLSAVRLGVSADHADAANGVSNLDLEFGRGIHAFGSSEYGDPLASRFDGRPDFSKMTLYVARLQSLGAGFSVLLAANGQLAFNHLLLPEVFGYGGEYFGRAYDASELVGDSGIAGKLELRYTRESFNHFGWTGYVFAEDGKVWNRLAALDKLPSSDSAVSVGGGLRVSIASWLSGYAEVTKPTNHVVAATDSKGVRVFGGLQVSIR